MSSSYILASLASNIVSIVYLYHYISNTEIHVYSCNVLRRVATICTNFVYIIPLFISIVRFTNIFIVLKINRIFLFIIGILLEVPNISKPILSLISTNITITEDTICGHGYSVENTFTTITEAISFWITIVAPIFAAILNYIIYKIAVTRLKKSSNTRKGIMNERDIFISVVIQSVFPLIFQLTTALLPKVLRVLNINNNIGWRFIDFIIYFGYMTCIIVSSLAISSLKRMVQEDFCNRKFNEHSNIPNKIAVRK
uniref:G_PROTEIN_RECEP_F1_2 domain-containing protein n=1 Tax=Parastrongyloides trichosuri TaxID=131310 RepID=A0A0N4Z4L4_PARTI